MSTPRLEASMAKIRAKSMPLAARIIQQGYCLTPSDVKAVVEIDRMMMLLVRCNNSRFETPAQNVEWLTRILEEHYQYTEKAKGEPGMLHGADYVRDISIPC